jgi:NADP-dependent 3-hydroxy acid dehydrogenase YdfG
MRYELMSEPKDWKGTTGLEEQETFGLSPPMMCSESSVKWTTRWIGSMSADVREKDSSVYVATKAGIQGFPEALRKEVNPLGIKVTLIEPGAVGTDMQPQTPREQRQLIEKMEMLRYGRIAD